MMEYDVIVIGGGLAGLQTTRLLAMRGLKVLCLEQRLIGEVITVTGLFVQEAFEELPFPRHLFGSDIARFTIHAPGGNTLTVEHPHYRFSVADMPAVLEWMAGEARHAGAEIRERHRLLDLDLTDTGVELLVQYPGGEPFSLTTKFVLGADGPRSLVASCLGLPRYRRFLHGVEELRAAEIRSDDGIHWYFGRHLAPGYLAWLIPAPGGYQVGVAGYERRGWSPARALEGLIAQVGDEFGLGELKQRRGGVIPGSGPRPVLVKQRVMLVGDAAGLVSPLTAGGIHYVLQHARRAAYLVCRFLDTGDPKLFRRPLPPELRRRLVMKQLVRKIYETFSYDWMIDLGMTVIPAMLRTRVVRRAFYGPGKHVIRTWTPIPDTAGSEDGRGAGNHRNNRNGRKNRKNGAE
jgi:flavin-dependent dehydrogenase